MVEKSIVLDNIIQVFEKKIQLVASANSHQNIREVEPNQGLKYENYLYFIVLKSKNTLSNYFFSLPSTLQLQMQTGFAK